MRAFTIDQLDHISTLQACLSVIADLAEPSTDLHTVDRGDLSVLIGYFSKELNKALSEGTPTPAIEQPARKVHEMVSV